MNEVIDIDNVIDKAIIKSLEYIQSKHGAKGLLAGGIKKAIRKKFEIIEDDIGIQSRIKVMYKRGILVEIKPSAPRKDKRKFYTLNENIEFNYLCGPLPGEVALGEGGSKEIPSEIRRHHTVKLQEAIKQWIAFFPEPNAEYPFDPIYRYQDDISKCKSHSLFLDLENHLPKMGYGVWSNWRKYREDLLKLQKTKEDILSVVKNDISKCFIGFRLVFISDMEYGINDYECNLIHKIVYDLVLDHWSSVKGYL